MYQHFALAIPSHRAYLHPSLILILLSSVAVFLLFAQASCFVEILVVKVADSSFVLLRAYSMQYLHLPMALLQTLFPHRVAVLIACPFPAPFVHFSLCVFVADQANCLFLLYV